MSICTASSPFSFVSELVVGALVVGVAAAYTMGCAPMTSQPAREATNETVATTSSSGGSNAFAASQAAGRQQAELDQLRGIVTTLLGAQAAARGLTAAERATLLAAARAITPSVAAVASVATPRPAQAPAAPVPTPAAVPVMPSSDMSAGMGLGMPSNGMGVTMPMPRVGAVNNVLFNGPTPWQNGNGLVGTTPFSITLINIPYAAEILIDGVRTCTAIGAQFTQMVVRGPTGGYNQICVAPPMPGMNQVLRALANGEGRHQVLIRYYSYSSYGGGVGQPVGSYAADINTLNPYFSSVITNREDMQ